MTTDEVQAAVDELAEQLQRSVVIDDPGVHMLYSSAHFGDEDAVRVQAILRRDAGSRAIGHVLAQGVLAWTTPAVIPPNDEIGMKSRVCVPIRWRAQLLGLLMVMDAEGTLTTTELATIAEAARGIAAMMAARAQDDPEAAVREQTVLDLVSREPAVRRRALADLAASRELERCRTVTAVELGLKRTCETTAASHVETALRSALMMRYPEGSAVELHAVTDGTALLLLGSSTPLADDVVRAHAQHMLRRVTDLSADRFDCVAGIGSSVTGLDRASETAGQARLARRAAASVLDAAVVAWTELGPYGPLLRIPGEHLNEGALPEEVRRLLAVDRRLHLTETLRAYLDSGCSGPAASRVLRIHRTTLYYRLGRITELTGLDLADGRTRLTLHLGLTMMDLMNADLRQ